MSGLPAPGHGAEQMGARLVEISMALAYALEGSRMAEVLELEVEGVTVLHHMGQALREAAREETRWRRVRAATDEVERRPGPTPEAP
jgi:hypothetical protein